jgi:glycosyltransferase involved in cell wall biosynthesis
MPLYVVDHRGGLPIASYERTPRVVVETDGASPGELPETLRSSAANVSLQTLASIRSGRVPREADAVVTWFSGDRLLQGGVANIWRDIRTPGRRCFVPVHLPCVAELDLIALEPRWLSGGNMKDFWTASARITRGAALSPRATACLHAIAQPWSQLLLALYSDNSKFGAGVEALARLAKGAESAPQIAALALRNLIVVLTRCGDVAKAADILQGALEKYPDYPELCYIGALLYTHQNKRADAIKILEKAAGGNHEFVGSGGETSYRSAWLMGRLALQTGNQSVAVANFHQGLMSHPVFKPAVEDLLRLRLPRFVVDSLQYDITRMVRQEPQYLKPVVDFFLLHGVFQPARRLVNTMALTEGEKEILLQRLAMAEATSPSKRTNQEKPGVVLYGAFLEQSSLARINREIAAALLGSGQFDMALEPACDPQMPAQGLADGEAIAKSMMRHPDRLDLTIRHSWPPNFEKPASGRLAVILPWEYGSVPRLWVKEIERNVDELWVPSRFVRDVFVRAGVSKDRVQVIPNGFDPQSLSPEGAWTRPTGSRKFMFLFVGGAILRKGIDVLLSAYARAFEAGDDVTLLVSTGANPAYSHNSQENMLKKFVSNPRLPHLAYLAKQLDEATLASLYRGCDAFVLPYRGEGFGMPIAEAMACGKPAITTAAGPAPEFCPTDCGYFVPAVETEVPEPLPPFGEFVSKWTWFEPDVPALAKAMRHVYENRDEAAARGRKAARAIRQNHTWDKITSLYLKRVTKLTELTSLEPNDAMGKERECQPSLSP